MSETSLVFKTPTNISLLGLIFITLKLTGYIGWSWWFVLMPLYLFPAIGLSVFVAFGLAYVFANKKFK